MKKLLNFWKIIIIDILGVSFMVLAIAFGWLPGPGGIPLFLVGLGLLAINHTWAQKYIDMIREYADKLGDLIFLNNSRVKLAYDIAAPVSVSLGIGLLIRQSAIWMISLGLFATFLGITMFLGNRGRWAKLKRFFKPNK